MSHFINFDFRINPQALAVQAALKQYADQPCFAGLEIQAWPHFNGRECGVCLTISHPMQFCNRLLISFGEDRRSDALFVQHTMTDRVMLNGPELGDFDDQSYHARQHFAELDVLAAVRHILSLVETWQEENPS